MKLQTVVATMDLASVVPLVASMTESLPGWNISFHILAIGCQDQTVGPNIAGLDSENVNVFDTRSECPPIYETRNICQKHLLQQMTLHGGYGLVLDDDLRWTMPEVKFNTLLKELEGEQCDMAFSVLSGDPPIPKEYTRACSLVDVLLAYAREPRTADETAKLRNFLDQFTIFEQDITDVRFAHHDFYAYNKRQFSPVRLELTDLRWEDFFTALSVGKTTTRKIKTNDRIAPSKGRERGPATLVLNPAALKVQNTALVSNGWVSRRSDMLMAIQANNSGHRLCSTPAFLAHDRKLNSGEDSTKKLIGDILGYALVESSMSDDCNFVTFFSKLTERMERTLEIIGDTNIMLTLFSGLLGELKADYEQCHGVIRRMLRENEKTIKELHRFDVRKTRSAFHLWRGNLGI